MAAISAGHGALGILFIGLFAGVFLFARHKAAAQESEPEVEPLEQEEVAPVEWFPKGVWGVETGAVQSNRKDERVIFDWHSDGVLPERHIYVGPGRGHEL